MTVSAHIKHAAPPHVHRQRFDILLMLHALGQCNMMQYDMVLPDQYVGGTRHVHDIGHFINVLRNACTLVWYLTRATCRDISLRHVFASWCRYCCARTNKTKNATRLLQRLSTRHGVVVALYWYCISSLWHARMNRRNCMWSRWQLYHLSYCLKGQEEHIRIGTGRFSTKQF